ncbi:MAG TPA: hypothetical protein VE944_05590 [Nostoc sp.]|uniref:hypothetical protein n=1 Tax=Nostoc sp. TaxID=1180 RepID=UPI002D67FAF1|nr:hypothetical protein [Nostoc sp.]HYX13837.1 hypothetical protein [Nostoc sp.]
MESQVERSHLLVGRQHLLVGRSHLLVELQHLLVKRSHLLVERQHLLVWKKVLAKTDVEIERLSWTPEQGRERRVLYWPTINSSNSSNISNLSQTQKQNFDFQLLN